MEATKRTKLLALTGAAAAVVLAGVCLGQAALSGGVLRAGAEGAPALGNTLGGNDTAVKGELAAYDPAVEAAHTGGVEIEGSEEEKLQQERIAGGAVGGVTSQNLEPVEGIVNGRPGDYEAVYGIELQAPDLPQAVLDAVAQGELTGLPQSHLDARVLPEECANCHAVA